VGYTRPPTRGLRATQDVLATALQQKGSLNLPTISLAHPMLLVRSWASLLLRVIDFVETARPIE